MRERNAMFVGVDFGTTNSALAVATGDAGDAQLARFAYAGGETTTFRSVLFFETGAQTDPAQPRVVGGPRAIDRYLAQDGGGRLMQSLKSYLGSALFESTRVGGTLYGLEELIAILLRQLREESEARFGPLARASHVVFGRPVRFANLDGDDESLPLDRLRRAAQLAGFESIAFEHEPVGAAYFYDAQLDHDELVLVADFGGGTSDFCLVRVGPGARGLPSRERILGTEGVGLAGDAFDSEVVSHVVAPRLGAGSHYRSYFDGKSIPVPPWIYAKLRRWHHLSFLRSRDTMRFLRELRATADEPEAIDALIHVIDDELGYALYRAVERAKLGLSREPRVPFAFTDPPVLDIRRDVDRLEFEQWIASPLDTIDACVGRLLAATGVAPGSIDRVFMTGGTSLVPAVRAIFARRFGEDRLRTGDELTSVAMGLALRARDLAR